MVKHGTPVWVAIAVAWALVMVAGGWRLGSGVVGAASDAEARLSKVSQVSAGQILANDSSDLGDLYQEVTQVSVDTEPAHQLMRWVWRFSPAFSALPAVRQEMAAWASQMERVQKDLDAASALLDSSSQLLDVYSEAQTMLQTTGAAGFMSYMSMCDGPPCR